MCDLVARKTVLVRVDVDPASSAVLCAQGWSPRQSKHRALDMSTSPGGRPGLQPLFRLVQTLQSVIQVAILEPRLLARPHTVLTTGPGSRTGGRASFVIARKSLGTEASEWGNCVREMLVIYCDAHATPHLPSSCHWLFLINQILVSGFSTYIYMNTSLQCDRFCLYAEDRHPFSLILGGGIFL